MRRMGKKQASSQSAGFEDLRERMDVGVAAGGVDGAEQVYSQMPSKVWAYSRPSVKMSRC